MQASDVNHTGSGDFEKNVFDMVSQTTSEGFTMTYDGINYIENKKLDADVTLAMDLDKSLYTFKDNKFKLNDFAMDFAGSILMPNDDIDLDLTFKALDTDFKTILSLVPGMYSEKFQGYKNRRQNGVQRVRKRSLQRNLHAGLWHRSESYECHV